MLLTLFIIVLLGVSIVVLLNAARNNASHLGVAKAICVLLTMILVIQMVGSIFSTSRKVHSVTGAIENAQRACGIYVGRQIASEFPNARVVVVVPPRESFPAGDEILIDHLTRTLEDKGAAVTRHELDIPHEVTTQYPGTDEQELREMMLLDTSMWLTPRRWAQLLIGFKNEADIVVSTVNCTEAIDLGFLPRTGTAPDLVLLKSQVVNFAAAFSNSCLHAAVVPRKLPDAEFRPGKVPRDIEEAFHQRFYWVNRDSVGSLLQQNQLD